MKANEAIKARVAELQDSFEEQAVIDKNQVVEKLAQIAFSSIKDVAEWSSNHVRIRSSDEIPEKSMAAIAYVLPDRKRDFHSKW